MKWFILIVFVIICVIFPFVRCVVLNFPSVVKNGTVDLFTYIRRKMWRNIPDGDVVGKIRIYTGLFGKGKTLSMVMTVKKIFNRYNNKIIWDSKRKKYVVQKVLVLSNVELNIPHLRLDSLTQVTDYAHRYYDIDCESDTYTAIICCIDEIASNLNSRSFKDNIDPIFLNTLLTCRKYHLAFYCTAQRFSMVDALFRQVTQEVVECNKVWRLQGQKFYDAYELENCVNPRLVEPTFKTCLFVRNKDYASYNTYAMVNVLEKHQRMGDLLSDDEIRNRLCPIADGADTVTKYSRLARKRKPHAKKYS